MSTKRGRSKLEEYFETGDRPTAQQFAELIHSELNQKDDDIHAKDNKIGIGTENPTAKLHVQGNNLDPNSDGILRIDAINSNPNSDANLRLGVFNGGTKFSWIQAHGNQPLKINSIGNNTLLNDTNGNVGIGTENPTAKLHVKGNIRVENGDVLLHQNDTNHGIGFYGPGKADFNNGNIPVNVDGPVVYGFAGGALGINKNGNQQINLQWDHSKRVGINGLGGISDWPYNFQVWGENNATHASVMIETQHNDAIHFYDRKQGNPDAASQPFTLVDKNGTRGFRFYSYNPNGWHTLASFTNAGTQIHKQLEIYNADSTKTGLKLPNGGGNNKVLVSDNDGNASWKLLTDGGLAGNSLVPKGVIVMWSGKLAPTGWELCDGNYDLGGNSIPINGTVIPDLRGRFIVGYHPDDVDYDNPKETGPDNNSSDYDLVDGGKKVRLKEGAMPRHNHNFYDGGHEHDIDIMSNNRQMGTGTKKNMYEISGRNQSKLTTKKVTTGIHFDSQGGNQPHENRPPYYVLAFIIKV